LEELLQLNVAWQWWWRLILLALSGSIALDNCMDDLLLYASSHPDIQELIGVTFRKYSRCVFLEHLDHEVCDTFLSLYGEQALSCVQSLSRCMGNRTQNGSTRMCFDWRRNYISAP
jgi:hypothetical protein